MENSAAVPVLSIQNVGKAYGENWVLSDISIDIMPGEIHAICGENGAGKSTLMNILFGMPVIAQTGGYIGKILVEGQACSISSPEQAIAKGIGMVHQEFMLIPGFTSGENIKLNREPLSENPVSRVLGSALKTVDFLKISQQSQATLDKLGVSLDESRVVNSLPVGYMQFVEIAREIDKENIKLLILDEPTAVLTESEAEIVLQIVKRLSKIGIAVLLITHRINDIMEVADTVTILRDGKNVKSIPVSQTAPGEIAQMMVGRELDLGSIQRRQEPLSGEVALSLRDFYVDMPGERVKGIDLDVYRGEILGIGGLAGQGKNGIANGIMGIYPAKGTVTFNGAELPLNNARQAIRAGLGFVSEDRKGVGLLLNESIELNICFTAMQNQGKFCYDILGLKFKNGGTIREHAKKMIQDLDIRCTSARQHTGSLSGGNQQKVCIARALTQEPTLLLVSEPTRGIDIGAKKLVLDLLKRLNEELGMTIIMTSSELAELRSISDRIAIICDGRVAGLLKPDDSDEAFGLMMSGITDVSEGGEA